MGIKHDADGDNRVFELRLSLRTREGENVYATGLLALDRATNAVQVKHTEGGELIGATLEFGAHVVQWPIKCSSISAAQLALAKANLKRAKFELEVILGHEEERTRWQP